MKILFHGIFLSAYLVLVALVLPADSFGAEPPISIECPCNVERVNQTKAVAKFSVAFDKEVNESGEFLVQLNHRDTIGNGFYSIFSSISASTLDYSSGANAIEVSLPFNAYEAANNQFLSLAIHSPTGSLIDSVALNESPMTIGDGFGVWPSADNQIVFDTPDSFQYNPSSFSFSVPQISNVGLKNVSDILKVEVIVANTEGSYYTKAEVETTVKYDAQGKGSLSVSGELSRAMDSHLALSAEHRDIQILLSRNDDVLLVYQVGVLEGGSMPTFALNLNNIDTLTDSDNDGITDFNERLIGTSANAQNSIGPVPIEVAFTYGTSAQDNEGDGLQARLAFITAVANTALADSGVNVVIQNVGSYAVGEDTSLAAEQMLDALKTRDGIFSNIDNVLQRTPDFFIHLSTAKILETGGLAPVLGAREHGILDYQNYYSLGINGGAVAIDNISLTLMHELGHLMGLGHARRQYEDTPGGTFRWSSGYGVDNDFATLMAYNSEFRSASWLNLLSSPDRKCGLSNSPCGVDRGDYLNGADSVTSLAVTALQASAISNGFPPTVTLYGNKTVNLTIGQSYSEPGFSADDKEDGNLTASAVVTNNIDNTKSGTYTVTYEVSDSDGNQSSSTRTVVLRSSEWNDSDSATIIFEDTTWDSDVVLDGNVEIEHSVTLTVAPGATIEGKGYAITVYGNFLADGVKQNIFLRDVNLHFSANRNTPGYIRITDAVVLGGELFSSGGDTAGYGSWDLEDSIFRNVGNKGNNSNSFHLTNFQSDSTILRNVFENCGGMVTELRNNRLTIKNNIFINPIKTLQGSVDAAIENIINVNDGLIIEHNSFLSLDKYALAFRDVGDANAKMFAPNNYFGTTDEAVIQSMILDRNDGLRYPSYIEYKPFLQSPNPDTPDFIPDSDYDGVNDNLDAFPEDDSETIDTDSDGIGNNKDTDDDGDGVGDASDSFPLDSSETLDSDGDGIGNNADTDDDNDGVLDEYDDLPLDATESIDTDSDGIGNNADTDDDGDSLSDSQETNYGTNPLIADSDGDGYLDGDEVDGDTDPLDADDAPDIGLNWFIIRSILDANKAAD